jgi:hypothetical protein
MQPKAESLKPKAIQIQLKAKSQYSRKLQAASKYSLKPKAEGPKPIQNTASHNEPSQQPETWNRISSINSITSITFSTSSQLVNLLTRQLVFLFHFSVPHLSFLIKKENPPD